MKQYEVMYILKPSDKEDYYENAFKKYEDVINHNNGKVEKTDKWGIKRLAYVINDCKDGYYVLSCFTGTPSTVNELDRVLRLDENVLRHMIISKGE